MTEGMITYIPFKYCSYTKPVETVYENLDQLNWVVQKDGSVSVNNIITEFSQDTTAVHNNDETFVLRLQSENLVDILGKYRKISQTKLVVSALKEQQLFENNDQFKNVFLQGLDSICQFNEISIVITNNRTNCHEIILIGFPDNIKAAENKVRILIENLDSSMYIDWLELDTISLLPLVGGIELNNFKQIAKQTNCHLYLPNILPNTYLSDVHQDSKIYISGIKSQVLLTKHLISKIKANVTSPYIKSVPIEFNKKTMLLLLNYHEKILSIMYKNECFIQIPGLDSRDSTILFQANNLDAVEKSIKDFICLIGEIYGAGCHSCDNLIDADTDKILLDMSSYGNCMLQAKERRIKIIGSRTETKRTISLLSNYQPTISSLQKINRVEYSLELNNEERDFIGGKKNGKILKIMNNSNSIVKIIPFSDFSFIVELNCQSIQTSIPALQMIEDELPMSVNFNIPESFHRQIIGVGGATVQTIMRRYNVFIKFSNTFVFNSTDDTVKEDYTPIQLFINKSNVVIKCPAKNGANIPYAKLEVEKLVQNCSSMNFFNTFIKLSRSHWRLLSNNSIGINNEITNLSKNSSNSTFITDLEKRTNTLIKFPRVEPTSLELLEIKGVERNSEECAKLFEALLPKDYEFKLAYNPIFQEIASFDRNSKLLLHQNSDLSNNVGFKFLNEISVPFKLLYNIEVQVFYNPKLENDEEDLFTAVNNDKNQNDHFKSMSLSSLNGKSLVDAKYRSLLSPNFEYLTIPKLDSEIPQFHSIILSYFENDLDKNILKNCLEILTSFLRENKIIIIDKNFNDSNLSIVNGSSSAHASPLQNLNNSEFNKENMNITEQFIPQQPYQDQQRPLQQQQYYNYQQQLPQQKPQHMQMKPFPNQLNQSNWFMNNN